MEREMLGRLPVRGGAVAARIAAINARMGDQHSQASNQPPRAARQRGTSSRTGVTELLNAASLNAPLSWDADEGDEVPPARSDPAPQPRRNSSRRTDSTSATALVHPPMAKRASIKRTAAVALSNDDEESESVEPKVAVEEEMEEGAEEEKPVPVRRISSRKRSTGDVGTAELPVPLPRLASLTLAAATALPDDAEDEGEEAVEDGGEMVAEGLMAAPEPRRPSRAFSTRRGSRSGVAGAMASHLSTVNVANFLGALPAPPPPAPPPRGTSVASVGGKGRDDGQHSCPTAGVSKPQFPPPPPDRRRKKARTDGADEQSSSDDRRPARVQYDFPLPPSSQPRVGIGGPRTAAPAKAGRRGSVLGGGGGRRGSVRSGGGGGAASGGGRRGSLLGFGLGGGGSARRKTVKVGKRGSVK